MASAAAPLVVDTDVLIDYLRGWEQAVDFLERCEQPLAISVITIAELNASSLIPSLRPLRSCPYQTLLLLSLGCGGVTTDAAMARAWPMP